MCPCPRMKSDELLNPQPKRVAFLALQSTLHFNDMISGLLLHSLIYEEHKNLALYFADVTSYP